MNFKFGILLLAAFLALALCEGETEEVAPPSGSGSTGDETFTADVEASTKNLLGLSCLAEAILTLADNADDFTYDVKLCGVDPPMDVSFVIDDIGDLASLADKIVQYNDNLCDNAAYKEESDASTKPSDSCATTIQRNMAKLQTDITAATTDIGAAVIKNTCLAIAVSNIELTLGNVSKKISNCAKLAGSV